MKINAAILDKPGDRFVIEQLELHEPAAGEVLVKIAASGVCHSDWHLVTGATRHPMPVVAGHEGAGIVQAVGENVIGIRPGDHVILNWAPACGHCFYCQQERPNLCDTFVGPIWAGTMLDGTTRLYRDNKPVYHWCGLASFADHAVVPQESCVVIRRDVPLTIAALVGCAVATGVGAAMYTAAVRPGDSVAILGCGGVGLSIIQGAKLCGAATIIAVDTNASKLALARSLGATHAVVSDIGAVSNSAVAFPGATGGLSASAAAPAPGSSREAIGSATLSAIRDLTGGRGADHVFEAVGVPALQERALDMTRPGGTLVLAGLTPIGTVTNFSAAAVARQEKTIKGCYYGSTRPGRDFPLILDLYRAGRLDLDQLITRQYKLDQINDAFAAMLSGQVARGVIVF